MNKVGFGFLRLPETDGVWTLAELPEEAEKILLKIHPDWTPSDCIACRSCEEHCPQRIAISEEMGRVAEIME